MKKEKQLDANGHRKFGIRDCIAYAAGDLGCNMSFALKGTMAIFWTQFMKLDLWYALLLVVVQVWDAVNDPLIGSIIDADKHKYKRKAVTTILTALLSYSISVAFSVGNISSVISIAFSDDILSCAGVFTTDASKP